MLFGRAFEQALAALFRHEDAAAILFEQWAPCKDLALVYSDRDTWDSMLRQGVQLLERFTQDGRVKIRRPKSHQQIQFTRRLSGKTASSSSLMLLGSWTAQPVCWSGRPHRPAIRQSQTELRPLIHS